jgi:hypothetical protein
VGLTQTPCLRLVMRRSAVGDDRRLRTKVSNSASADTCTHMDSPGPLYAGARLRPGGRASLIRQRSVVQVHLGPPLAPLVSGNTTQRPSRTCSRYSSALRRKEAQMAPSDWVLDELAAVEHAVIAEYLQIAYGLGHRLPDPAPGPAGPAIADAAQKILSMAQFVEMKHLKLVNEYLVASGRQAQLGQAVGIDHSLGSGAMTVFGPLRENDLLALVERETALAKAVDARYARLRPEVDPDDRA